MILLPEELFRLIQTFLPSDDYHSFLNTSKELFENLKRKTIFFPLSNYWSYQYIREKDFQRLLLSKVENGWNQIEIRLSNNGISVEEIPFDLPIRAIIDLKDIFRAEHWNKKYKSMSFLYNAPISNTGNLSLNFEGDSIDLSAFQSLSRLDLLITTSHVPDITPLKDIPDLTLRDFHNVTDFSMFKSQRVLKMIACEGLSDVSSFRFIRKIRFYGCSNLIDVSPLNGVYDLTIISCLAIKDISTLGNHHSLTLEDLSRSITNFNCLLHIPHVSIKSNSIKDLTVLRYAKSVILEGLFSDVSPLRDVRKVELKINFPTKVIGLEELRDVPDLSVEPILNTGDDVISCLKNQRLEWIGESLQITSLAVISKMIRHLTIRRCKSFTQFINEGQGSLLSHLASLTLYSLSVKTLEGLGDIPTVTLISCHPERLDGLGRNKSVKLIKCSISHLNDLSSLATVPMVTLKDCGDLSLFSEKCKCLQKVPRLKIINEYQRWQERNRPIDSYLDTYCEYRR